MTPTSQWRTTTSSRRPAPAVPGAQAGPAAAVGYPGRLQLGRPARSRSSPPAVPGEAGSAGAGAVHGWAVRLTCPAATSGPVWPDREWSFSVSRRFGSLTAVASWLLFSSLPLSDPGPIALRTGTACVRRRCVTEPLSLEPDAGQEFAERGSVARRGSCRVLGCEHKRGAMVDGDRDLHEEAAAWRAVHAQ